MTETGEIAAPHYDPHPGLDCCPCVPRLRKQNQDAAAKRDAEDREMRSDLHGLKHLMAEAFAFHRKGNLGISQYGQAVLAEALRIADEKEAELDAVRIAMHRERRARVAAEDRMRAAYKRLHEEPLSGSKETDG